MGTPLDTYTKLLHELDSYSKKFLDNQFIKWQKDQSDLFNAFDNIFKKTITTLQNPDLQNSFQIWTELEKTFRDLIKWIKNINLNPDNISEYIQDWHTQIEHFFNSFPKVAEINIENDFWLKENKDSFYKRTWKFYNRRKNGIKNILFNIKKISHKILKKPLTGKKPLKKEIVTQDFFNYYFTIPFISSLYKIWQDHLQLVTRQLAAIHRETEQIVHPLFSNDNFVKLLDTPVKHSKKLLDKLDSFNQIHVDFQEKYNVFKKERLAAYKTFLVHQKNDTDYFWTYAGTFILPARKYNSKKFNSAIKAFEKRRRDNNDAWKKHLQGEKSDWQKDVELNLVQLFTGHVCHKTFLSLNKKQNELSGIFEESCILIEKSLKDFKTKDFNSADVFKENLLSISRTMLRTLHREKLPHLVDKIINSQFSKSIENYLLQLEKEVENLSEEFTIFRSQDLDNIPPQSKFIDIPLKDVITEEIFLAIKKEYFQEIKVIDTKTDMLIRSVSENDQIIELNFDTALELLESDEEHRLNKAIKVATDGLERSARQLRDLINESTLIINRTNEKLIQDSLRFEKDIQALSDNEKIIALKIHAEKARNKEKIRAIGRNIFQRFKNALPDLIKFIISQFKKLQDVYYRIRKITGLGTVSTDVEEKLSQFLFQTQKQLKFLPFVYQRLFRFQPLDDSRFFSGRDEQMTQLKNQLDQWKNSQFALTALVGEKGSGRTTILNFAEKEFYNNLNLIKIDLTSTIHKTDDLFKILSQAFKLEHCKDMDDLEQQILNKVSSHICVLENLHKMFLRISDGFDALERFLLFISNTHRKIHWVVTCGVYSWNYLDKVLNISRFFHKTIVLPELDTEDIKKVILKRHRVSGYKLYFKAPEHILNSRKFKKLPAEQDKQDFLSSLFFEQLSKLSAGNITVAILFWLSSIIEIREDSLVIAPVIEFDASFMQNIPADDLFTFAAFLQHETLTTGQHAMIFNHDLQKSLLVFNRMKNKGLLTETANGYQVHYLLYRPVVRSLKINNLLL